MVKRHVGRKRTGEQMEAMMRLWLAGAFMPQSIWGSGAS